MIHATLARTGALLAAAVCLAAGCSGGGGGGGGDGGGGGAPPIATPVEISVSIDRFRSDVDGSTAIGWDVAVMKDGLYRDDATVSINGKNVPLVGGFVGGWYSLTFYQDANVAPYGEASYAVGQDYTVTVQLGSETYQDTLPAPGGISIDPSGSSVAWTDDGTFGWVNVRHEYGSDTYSSGATIGNHLTSPLAIPASAYPTSGTYRLSVGLQNFRQPASPYPGFGYFDTLVGHQTYFYVQDGRETNIAR